MIKLREVRERWRQLPRGPWFIASSCSWRRILVGGSDEPVLIPNRYSDSDPQPTLDGAPGVLEAIVESRVLVPELIDMVEDLQGKLTETITHGGQMLACSPRVKAAYTVQRSRARRYKAMWHELHQQRENLPPKADPTDVLDKIADFVKEPLECGHPLDCWDDDREVCVWCECDVLRAEVASLESAAQDHQNVIRRDMQIAYYLADCHAATAQYDGMLRSTSKSRRLRFAGICRKALALLRNEYADVRLPSGVMSQARIIERLEDAIETLEG